MQCAEVLVQPLDVAGSRNGDDIGTLRQQPGERELGWRAAFLRGHGFDLCHQIPVAGEVLALEARVGGSSLTDVRQALNGTGEEAAAERRIGDKTDAELPRGLPRLLRLRPVEERVFRLDG